MAASTAQVTARVEELDILGEFSASSWDTPKENLAARSLRNHTEAAWGDVFLDGMACWVLHRLTLAKATVGLAAAALAGGPVTAIRTKDESVVFQAVTNKAGNGDALYMRTAWGQEYLNYRNSRPDAHAFITDAKG